MAINNDFYFYSWQVRSAIQGEVNKQVFCDVPPTAKVSPDVGGDSKSGSPKSGSPRAS